VDTLIAPTTPRSCFLNAEIEVLVSRLDVAPETAAAEACLSDDERQRARRYRHDRDRRRFVVARGRLRQLLGERLGVPPAAVELACGRNGKPALAPRFAGSGWRFNVSHCGEIALYALSRRREVGVDVEAVRVLEEGDEIARRFFSRREVAAYRALAPRDRPLGFFNCWTRKEAFVKALGVGLSLHLERFDVSLAPGEPARLLRIERGLSERAGWRLAAFSPLPGYVAALASRPE
jgi:4'-phosphopantetheinyl transferase